MEGLKIAVIGGGSSYTPELIDGFIKRKEELPVKEIYLVDIKEGEKKLNIVGNLAKRMVEKAGLNTKVVLTLDRKEAIKDADYVITQFRVGGLKARARDENIPLRYNVLGQETTGAGGFAKALRTIPVIMDICKDIEELSSDAWLINFTNPAGLIAETVLRYTNVKAMGLCNVPVNMKNTTARMFGVEPERIKMDFIGLNHLSWAKDIYLDGKDIMKEVIEKNLDDESLNMNNIPNLNWDKDYLNGLNMLPSPYLRYYYMMDEMVQNQIKDVKEGKGTRAEQVMKIEEELFELYNDENLDIKPPQLEKRGGAYYSEAAVSLISAIHNDKKEIHVVNIKNNGAIPNLDNDVVIECNAFVDKTGATPMTIGKMHPIISGLVNHVKAYELLTAEAGITGDYRKALEALYTSPLIPSVTVARKLLDDILEENKEYLPQFNR
ncbi:6-phospho-beta-glucosidase [Anaerosalibacter massiliensis]|uniref:6-phospho-beta-glucosidase n=1 Tax=Anaerosalibacter massiliensis TaxID=1347392 RepID=A0A9X2S5F7_9FIRM|nr:6-phospho-beta-glucosidase [Anaerosalibacter massiliensis]MCR2044503.1 6-phospho-beta-glucosidase [Anaerosalibacter massiliensis]